MFWESMDLVQSCLEPEDKWVSMFSGQLAMLLPPEERLSLKKEFLRSVWVSVGATLSYIAAISWRDKESCRFPLQ